MKKYTEVEIDIDIIPSWKNNDGEVITEKIRAEIMEEWDHGDYDTPPSSDVKFILIDTPKLISVELALEMIDQMYRDEVIDTSR